MDAIDTQKQEIHYELHRLSSRLNNMDIDEDISVLEVSLERERITWEGEILGYTGGFSPERELSRLGEK
ncbi:hypothetical protein Lal_00045136 [Lupinus albus]|nr:hypothetical protein Lal_00045136 [Lupinus albus]